MRYDIKEKKVCPHKTELKNLFTNKSIVLPTQYALKVKRVIEKADYRSLDIVNVDLDGIKPKTELFKFDVSLPGSSKESKIRLSNDLTSSKVSHRRSYLINLRGYVMLKIPMSIKDKMLDFLSLPE